LVVVATHVVVTLITSVRGSAFAAQYTHLQAPKRRIGDGHVGNCHTAAVNKRHCVRRYELVGRVAKVRPTSTVPVLTALG